LRIRSLGLVSIVALLRMACLPLLAVGVVVSAIVFPLESSSLLHAEVRACTLVPSSTLAVVRVAQDTTLPFAPSGPEPLSFSGMRAGPGDSLVVTLAAPMPAARVRLLDLDSTTRTILAMHGVMDRQPIAFIRAEPYRADCRTIRWTDSVPFVEPGEVGYVRATLVSREQWIGHVPVLVIRDVWNYPYPRRRGLAFNAAPHAPLAPAQAMFSLNATLEIPRSISDEARIHADSARRSRALAWARANPVAAEMEPARTLVRRAVLEPDWQAAERFPSRLRGTYRVDIEASGERSTWFFRTHDRPGYGWRGPDSLQTTAALIAMPYVSGYRLVAYTAGSLDSLPKPESRGPVRVPLVWLATDDRPTTPGNDARRSLSGILEFTMAATPERLWDDLEPFVPKRSARDSALLARLKRQVARGEQQPQLPLSIQLDERGGVRADTTLTVGGRTLRVVLQQIDTLSISRPF
jgi:hypothetical protein